MKVKGLSMPEQRPGRQAVVLFLQCCPTAGALGLRGRRDEQDQPTFGDPRTCDPVATARIGKTQLLYDSNGPSRRFGDLCQKTTSQPTSPANALISADRLSENCC